MIELHNNEFLSNLFSQATDVRDGYKQVAHHSIQVGDVVLIRNNFWSQSTILCVLLGRWLRMRLMRLLLLNYWREQLERSLCAFCIIDTASFKKWISKVYHWCSCLRFCTGVCWAGRVSSAQSGGRSLWREIKIFNF